jgi:UDP-glucose 4-epimerase
MMMKLLLTGGAGYVGSACLRWLVRHGHDPIAFDDLSEGNRGAVPSNRLIVGNIEDRVALVDAMRQHKFDAVLHFAAVASVPESIAQPELYWRVNVVGTKNVLDAMLEAGVNRIVFSSTAATYSFSAPMPLDEDSLQEPQTPYGTTKLAGEQIIREYGRAYGIGRAFLRYFNASGADPDGRFGEDRNRESHLIPLILMSALGKRGPVKIYGTDCPTPDGTCIRDFIHTDDLAQAHQLVVSSLSSGEERIYNLGSGVGTSVLETLRACEKAVGSPIPFAAAPPRDGDPAILIATPEKLQRELGYTPQYNDVGQIVETAWRWHQSHPQGYAPSVTVG